jgi:hypothetical protein
MVMSHLSELAPACDFHRLPHFRPLTAARQQFSFYIVPATAEQAPGLAADQLPLQAGRAAL